VTWKKASGRTNPEIGLLSCAPVSGLFFGKKEDPDEMGEEKRDQDDGNNVTAFKGALSHEEEIVGDGGNDSKNKTEQGFGYRVGAGRLSSPRANCQYARKSGCDVEHDFFHFPSSKKEFLILGLS
jgi:hypothetical protein